MERRVNFQQYMDMGPSDLNAIQEYTQTSLDHVVGDAITSARKFAGFAAAATTVVQMTVQPGRLIVGGKVFARDIEFAADFTNNLPLAAKKYASLVVFGTEADTNAVARQFLIDEETNASEARVVATQRARIANVNIVYGNENADPLPPIVDAGVLVVANILLTPAGIASITAAEANRLDSVASVSARVAEVEDFRDKARPQIASLSSDIAALTAGQSRLISGEMYGRTLSRLAVLEAKSGIPDNATDSYADYFLDTRGSDLAFSGSSVKIEEGIRFADENKATAPLALLNPINAATKLVGSMLFPMFDLKLRQRVGPVTGEVQLSQYSYATNQIVQRTVSRRRIRFGATQTVCTNSTWWRSGLYDSLANVFRIAGETWSVAPADLAQATIDHQFIRVTQFWEDFYEEPYWDVVSVPSSVNGTQVAETFLQGNDMWLGAIGLTFTRLAADGAVTIAVTETERGMPVLDKVISKTTVQRGDLQANGETTIPIQPVFLTGGKRYAIVIITAGNHWVGTVQGSAFPQGTMFYVLDGAYQQGDATRDIAFSLHAAEFQSSRSVIELQSLQLDGGIAAIDITAPMVVPGSTGLDFEVMVGGTWYPLARATQLVLGAGGNVPPLLPFRAIFTGTPDVQPAMQIGVGSQVVISRPRKTLSFISTARTLPGAGSSQIRLLARYENFDPAHHTASAKLLTGAGHATEVGASAVVDVNTGDALERTFIFNLGAPVTSFRAKHIATTDSALNVFHHAWRKDYAL